MNILNLLDKDQYSAEQIAQNYQILLNKWGEVTITNVGGFQIRYIDISKAFVNGASISFLIVTLSLFAASIVFGKILFPQLAKFYLSANEQMADLAAIRTQEIIKEKKNKGDWF